MNEFIISANQFLKKDTIAYYHSDYEGGGKWKEENTIENIICTLKNDVTPFPEDVLVDRINKLIKILDKDFYELCQKYPDRRFTVCVVPRAKKEEKYKKEQLLFRQTVKYVVHHIEGMEDGTNYIIRHTDPKTTHWKTENNGREPYPGITKDTCILSDKKKGKDILFIDDVYTYSINIDEDAIQCMYDFGANSVIFYSVGKTINRNFVFE